MAFELVANVGAAILAAGALAAAARDGLQLSLAPALEQLTYCQASLRYQLEDPLGLSGVSAPGVLRLPLVVDLLLQALSQVANAATMRAEISRALSRAC